MTRLHRFFLKEKPTGDFVFHDRDQSHHLKKVLRIKKGTIVELFESDGSIYQGVLESFPPGRDGLAGIRIINNRLIPSGTNATGPQITCPPTRRECEIMLATAVPKGKRMDWLVQKLAELGLKRLIPLKTARSEIDVISKPDGTKFNRWRKIAVEAAKQSGQPVIEITAADNFAGILPKVKNYDLGLIASPESRVNLSEVLKKK
ncbi:MAG: RsmE family RNA methyltransferase [Planctomycetota bacterium]